MQKDGRRNKKKWLTWAALVVAAFFLTSLAVQEFQRWDSLRSDIAETKEEIEETEKSVDELSGKLSLISDPEYLEKEARRTLNVKKTGEELYLVVGLDEIKKDENFEYEREGQVEQMGGVWDNIVAWWSFFFATHGA